MPEFGLDLLPKQSELYDELKYGTRPVIGIYGGRGSSKSSGIDRVLLSLMYEEPGLLCCVVMRNYDQVKKYHIDTIKQEFPWLQDDIVSTMPSHLDIGTSRMDFSYAESLDDVKRRFMSGNYAIIAIDQAEQFTAEEIREMRRANRIKGGKMARIVLSFNMRGASIQELKKWFVLHEVNKDEDPNDYVGYKWNPWDNVYWCLDALQKDGYSIEEYYSWTDQQRMDYAANNGPYTHGLSVDDEVIRQADWYGSWESIEGTYFANSFDLESTRITPGLVEAMRKPWATHWISGDWGKSHWTAIQWHYRVTLSPSEIARTLGWTVQNPLNVTVTYREMYVCDLESPEVAKYIVDCTPTKLFPGDKRLDERSLIKAFYLGRDAFADEDSPLTTAIQIGKVMREFKMPTPERADDDRIGGYTLMSSLLRGTKGHGWVTGEFKVPSSERRNLTVEKLDQPFQVNDVWLISNECVELLKSIPLLMRDPKKREDVLKTDKSLAKIEMDSTDAARYGLKSMLNPRKKTDEMKFQEQMSELVGQPAKQTLLAFKHAAKTKGPKSRWTQSLPPSWRSNVKEK